MTVTAGAFEEHSLSDRFQSKKHRATLRLLLASLTFHALVLSAMVLFNGSGNGAGTSAGEGSYSVTWLPGDGGGRGKGLDTTIPGDESGDSLQVNEQPQSASAIGIAKTGSHRLLLVSETDPQAVFNRESSDVVVTSPVRDFTSDSDADRTTNAVAADTRPLAGSSAESESDEDEDELEPESGTGPGHGAGGEKGSAGGGAAGSGEGRAEFFGITAKGRRVVYVIDASESMAQHHAMVIACRELWVSLKDLAPTSQFQIVFFNRTNYTMNRPGERWQLLPATSNNLRLAKRFLKGIQPDSGTDRFQAIKLALSVNPDIVFLLTDVDSPELSTQELYDIQRGNRRKAKIHVVEFGIDADLGRESFLKKLARQNDGTHVYRDLSRKKFSARGSE